MFAGRRIFMPDNDHLSPVESHDLLDRVAGAIRLGQLSGQRVSAVRIHSGSYWSGSPSGAHPGASRGTGREGRAQAADALSESLVRLERLHASLTGDFAPAISQLGAVPPEPPSLRGLLGGKAISWLRKLLWWYTHSLRIFGNSTERQLHCEAAVIESVVCALEETRAEVAALRQEILQLKGRQEAASGPPG